MNTTLFVNNLTVIDCSYLDLARGLIGMSWQVDVELSGELDAQGMIFDFGLVKKTLKKIIDQEVDHKLLIPAKAKGLIINSENSIHVISAKLPTLGNFQHRSPQQAIGILATEEISAITIAEALTQSAKKLLPKNITGIRITLQPEIIDGPSFQYSHGLKKHNGACQRIAHGHRSRLEIYCDDKPHKALSEQWCQKWQHIYLGTQHDLQREFLHDGIAHFEFAYTANEGHYSLALPKQCCYLIPSDSTIENIAEYLLKRLQQNNLRRWTVKIFEGINKGAIAKS